MKVSLPRSLALKVADYLESDVARMESCYWDFGQNRITPRSMRLEVERVKKWVAQIHAAGEPTPTKPVQRKSAVRSRKIIVTRVPAVLARSVKVGDEVSSVESPGLGIATDLVVIHLKRTGAEFFWDPKDLTAAK